MTQPVEFLYVVPVGAVIAWWPLATTDPAPPCFAICDGKVVSDPDSPYNGRAVPDLRGQFILGTAPGTTPLGAVTGSSAANLVGPTNPQDVFTGPTDVGWGDVVNNNIVQGVDLSMGNWRYVLSNDTSIKDGNHHHLIPAGAVQIEPPGSVALYYIVRIK